MRRGLTVGQPSKIDTLKTKKIFLLKHKHLAKADFKNTFSVSGQIRIYHPSDRLKLFKTLRLLHPLYHKNSKSSRLMAQNLHRCNQRLHEMSNQIPAHQNG